MKRFSILIPVLGCFIVLGHPILSLPSIAQTPSTKRAIVNDRVTVQARTVKLIHGKGYPPGKEATIQYPQVTGLTDPTLLNKVQKAISLKRVLGQSIEEFRNEFQTESSWLSEIYYKVNYNRNFLLDITFTRSGVGAYPSAFDQRVVVDLKTGNVLKASDLFKQESMSALVALVNKSMQEEIRQKDAEIKRTQSSDDMEFPLSQLKQKKFQAKDLNQFSISDRGITFFYDYGFPHVIKALEPSGQFFFTYDQLKPFIRSNGALSLVMRSR
jgi:hypothetical protein